MLTLKGRIDYRRRSGGEGQEANSVSDLRPPVPDWCPHCGGSLKREPPLFQHPCFDDMAWAIVPEEQSAKTAEEQGCRSAHPPFRPFAIRPQPGAWRVLSALRAAFGHFVSRDYLLAQVRPRRGEDADPKIVEVYLCHLRKALKDTPFTIESRRGAGCWRLICRDQESGIRNQDLS